jgi:hypothetical protein
MVVKVGKVRESRVSNTARYRVGFGGKTKRKSQVLGL